MLEVLLSAAIGLLLVWLYDQLALRGRYWARRGVSSLQPLPFFGNALRCALRQKHPTEVYRDIQEAFPEEQVVGYYDLLLVPRLLVLGPEYVELVLIKEFGHFSDRTPSFHSRDPASIDSYQLFTMHGSKWRAFRYKLTPLFTSGKLKYMYQNYDFVGEKLLKYYETHSKRDVILKDVMHFYSMDFVGSYDALQYPLMFPNAEDGYHLALRHIDPEVGNEIDKKMSPMEFYSFRLMTRSNDPNRLLRYRQLTNQYMVDMYAKVETERLTYLRTHQKEIRSEEYAHLQDALREEISARDVGRPVILPSSFVGGPRRAIFGLNSSCLENPGSEYHKKGTEVLDLGLVKVALMAGFPRVYRLLGLSYNNQATVKYFCKIIQDAFNYREENNISRNDFIQMMMDLKEKGRIEIQKWDPNDDYLKEDGYSPKESFEITDVSLMAQAYTFMTVGPDGVALTSSMAFYELSLNQNVQDKARAEILEQIKAHSGLTYEALSSMTYLGNIVSEILRLHPLSPTLFRVCTKDYTFPNGLSLKVGDHIQIPMLAIHRNPNFFPEPDKFMPERFQYPMKTGTYFPFGDGPRMCIAMRFALLQIRYGLARTLSKYRVRLSPRTETPIKMEPYTIFMEPRQTLYFDLEEIS